MEDDSVLLRERIVWIAQEVEGKAILFGYVGSAFGRLG
tara:strand:- start:223 stop:336 length:114 start_codon:yes stop_codon:yes gene_type:complete